MITNQVTRAVFELLGNKTATGYSLTVKGDEIPLFLNKDGTTKYPQIRVSPFVEKGDRKYQHHISEDKRAYRHWQYGIFQVDIYTKNLPQAQNIYDVISKRLHDFFTLETVIFNDNGGFEEVEEHLYRNKAYALLDDDMFKDVYGIRIQDTIIKRVRILDALKMNSFYVDDEYLYIKTDQDLKDIEIKMLLQGRLFSNGFAYSDNGLHSYRISKQRNLSLLEDNEVERISFDLELLFSKKINRERLPEVNQVIFPKLNVK